MALDRLKDVMGLRKFSIDLEWGDQETPPAYVNNVNNQYMTITMSRKLRHKREQLSALVHEMSYIAVWSLEPNLTMRCGLEESSDRSLFKGTHLEKVVDTSGIFQGQGIFALNGLTDDVFFVPGQSYAKVEKTLGYLKPDQYGYLLARYCESHGILPQNVEPFIHPTSRKYFKMGWNYLKRSRPASRRVGQPLGFFWCPKCGERITVDLAGELSEIRCSKCSFHRKTISKLEQTLKPVLRTLSQYQQDFSPHLRKWTAKLQNFLDSVKK